MSKRTKQLIVRVTEEELEKIDALRGPVQRAVYMRQKSLGEATITDIPAINTKTYQELAKVGGNLNQLMKQINSSDSGDMFHHELIEQALAEVNELRQALIGAK
ncbi:MAG TPA: hypothetical protein VL020_07900 [Pseudomonadales bacterium]|nr:hypothetical protein [Pseudomonadales bacterium]